MREYSIPALVDVPATASLADVVFTRAASQPHSVIMRRLDGGRPGAPGELDGPSGWRDVTAEQFRDEVTVLAKGLIAVGVSPGDRVALMSRTRYEWTLVDYAIWAAGAVTVPIYETSSAEQVEWILSDSGASAAFAETQAHADAIRQADVAAVQNVWLIEGPDGTVAGPDGASVTDEQLEQHRTARKAADLATIIYTSGTTGRPKGCQITHGNLLSDVRNAVEGSLVEIFEIAGSSTLLFLPLAHSFARIIQVGCLESGAILGHWPDTRTVAKALPEFRPTFLLAVPRVFEKVYNTAVQQASASKVKSRIFDAAAATAVAWSQAASSDGAAPGQALRVRHTLFDRLVYAKLRAAVGGKVAYAVSGGAPLGERLGHFFRGAGITILEGYGLTETSAAATVNRPSRNKIGTVGPPLPGVAIKIADDGEILLRGPNVFLGYWHNDAATAEVLDPEGWFGTGDVGGLDEEGFLQVTGRKKELIVTAGGKNVAPAVLEDRLRSHALISQTMVVGDGRPFVTALITLDPDALGPWKERHGKPADATIAPLRDAPDLIAAVQEAVDDANKAVSRAESIRKFRILEGDFTQEAGQLTVKLGIRRSVLMKDFAADVEALYS